MILSNEQIRKITVGAAYIEETDGRMDFFKYTSEMIEALGKYNEKFRTAIANKATEQGFIHIDGGLLVPTVNELFTDGLHPNDTGFSLFAENLVMQMKKYI